MIRAWLLGGLAALSGQALAAGDDPMQALLESVRKERIEAAAADRAREQRFVEARDQRRAMLESAREELERERERAARLSVKWNGRQAEREALRERHAEATGELGEIAATFSQAAGDLRETLETSLTTLDHPQRQAEALRLSQVAGLPAVADLEALWELMLADAIATGTVSRFSAGVTDHQGVTRERPVVRAGDFTVVSDGRYLYADPRNGTLVEAAVQPAGEPGRMAKEFAAASGVAAPLAVDPRRGEALASLQARPGLADRIRQGGVIGYLILALGLTGLVLSVERWASLTRTARRIAVQRKAAAPDSGNPLGRLLGVRQDPDSADPESLALRLDEVILGELPGLRRGLGALAVIAAVAPLLGLLGTVTGIIETFQSLTLYGAGDPRMLSGGISLALVTTVMGLVVAIPLVIAHSVLSARSDAIVQTLDEAGAALTAEAAARRA